MSAVSVRPPESSADRPQGERTKTQRRIASCNPCRRRRTRCDRGRPCSNCVARQEGHLCVWDEGALVPLSQRDDSEGEAMKEEVRRLRNMVDLLMGGRQSVHALSIPHSPPFPSHDVEAPPRPPPSVSLSSHPMATHFDTGARMTTVPPVAARLASPLPPRLLDDSSQKTEPDDLVRKLGELTVTLFEAEVRAKHASKSPVVVDEARKLLDLHKVVEKGCSTEDKPPTLSIPESLLTATLSTDVGKINAPLYIPAKEIITEATNAHFGFTAWYLHPVTRDAYQRHEDAVLDAVHAESPPPTISLALCSALWSFGLFSANSHDLHWLGSDEEHLSAALAEQSHTCVTHLLQRPSLDVVRALLFLGSYYTCFTTGDKWEIGFKTMSYAVDASLRLGLHRDPSDTPGAFSAREAEERRRLFHAVFSKSHEINSMLGRNFTQLHASLANTKIPLNLHDHQLDNTAAVSVADETLVTPLLIFSRLARVAETITDELHSGVQPISLSRVRELDKILRKLQDDLPRIYKVSSVGENTSLLSKSKIFVINVVILHNLIRLHRPFLYLAYTDKRFAFSRATCVDTAVLLIKIQLEVLPFASCARASYAGLSGAIVLCIELIYGPVVPEAEQLKQLVRSAIKRLEHFSEVSAMSRRGIILLRFLLGKANERVPPATAGIEPALPPAKRPKLGLPTPDPYSATLSAGPSRSDVDTEGAPHRASFPLSRDKPPSTAPSALSSAAAPCVRLPPIAAFDVPHRSPGPQPVASTSAARLPLAARADAPARDLLLRTETLRITAPPSPGSATSDLAPVAGPSHAPVTAVPSSPDERESPPPPLPPPEQRTTRLGWAPPRKRSAEEER
ncbi:hypothetical protein JCM10207_003777 [Rhodosporidiobolus poonsookiae]